MELWSCGAVEVTSPDKVIFPAAGEHFPASIRRLPVPKRGGGETVHAVVDQAADLAYLANQNTLTFHMWTSSADHRLAVSVAGEVVEEGHELSLLVEVGGHQGAPGLTHSLA